MNKIPCGGFTLGEGLTMQGGALTLDGNAGGQFRTLSIEMIVDIETGGATAIILPDSDFKSFEEMCNKEENDVETIIFKVVMTINGGTMRFNTAAQYSVVQKSDGKNAVVSYQLITNMSTDNVTLQYAQYIFNKQGLDMGTSSGFDVTLNKSDT